MPEETTPPTSPTKKEIPAAVYALVGTVVTAMVTVLVAYFQFIIPAQQSIKATQTADELYFRRTETALARLPTFTATKVESTNTPTSTPTPDTPTATFTITPTDTPITSTVTSTFTLTPRPTATLYIKGSEYCVNARSIYVRTGPGTEYSYIGALTFQDCPFFDARNPDSTWIRASAGQPGYESLAGGWVRSDLVRPTDFDMLPVIEPTPTPTPTETPEPPPTITPTPTPEG